MSWNGCVFFKKKQPLSISGSKCTHFSSGKAWSIVFMRRAVLLWGVFVLPGNGALFHAKVNILHVLSIKF